MQPATEERSLGDLFAELADETRTLVSQELTLAKAELSEKALNIGKSVGVLAVGGFIVYAGLLAIIAAIILVLGTVVDVWLAALIVGIVVALIGYLLVNKGRNDLKSANLKPEKTLASLKEDKQWVQDQVK